MSEAEKAAYVASVVDPNRFTNLGVEKLPGGRTIRQKLPIVEDEKKDEEKDEAVVAALGEEEEMGEEEETVDDVESYGESYDSEGYDSSLSSISPSAEATSPSESAKKSYVDMVVNPDRFKNFGVSPASGPSSSSSSSPPPPRPSLAERLAAAAGREELERQNLERVRRANAVGERRRLEGVNDQQAKAVSDRARYAAMAASAAREKERVREEAMRRLDEYWEGREREERARRASMAEGKAPEVQEVKSMPGAFEIGAEDDEERREAAERRRRDDEEVSDSCACARNAFAQAA